MNIRSICKVGFFVLILNLIPLLESKDSSAYPDTQSVYSSEGQESHGGDSWSMEFTALGYRLVNEMKKIPVDKRQGIDLRLLRKTISRTQVQSTPANLQLNGIPVDAINYPQENKILISRQSWDKVKDGIRRRILVLHEYLWIMGINDSYYQFSSAVYTASLHDSHICELHMDDFKKKMIKLWGKNLQRQTQMNPDTAREVAGASLNTVVDTSTRSSPIRVLSGVYLNQKNAAGLNKVHSFTAVGECNPETGEYQLLAWR